MEKVLSNPEKFSFPNFCFEKKYENYLFLNSAILAESTKAEKYFFEILKELEQVNQQNSKSWILSIPGTVKSEYRDYSGKLKVWEIGKQLKRASLTDLYKYFISFIKGELKTHFIVLVDQFWMELKDAIGVYASFNEEIIVIGTKLKPELVKIKQKKLSTFEINIIKNNSVVLINGNLQFSKKEKEITVADFFYNSFGEYIDHWGPVFAWNKLQVDCLKEQFLNRCESEN